MKKWPNKIWLSANKAINAFDEDTLNDEESHKWLLDNEIIIHITGTGARVASRKII